MMNATFLPSEGSRGSLRRSRSSSALQRAGALRRPHFSPMARAHGRRVAPAKPKINAVGLMKIYDSRARAVTG